MIFKNILFAFILLTGLAVAAQPKPMAVADKVEILIGEQLQLKLTASFTTDNFNADGFAIPDSIKHFEILERGPVDSSLSSGVKNISQTITLTSFDSGVWAIPRIGLLTRTPAGYSDSILIKVGFDPTKIEDINDIKSIEEVSVNTGWIYWTLGGITLLALVGFVIFLYRTRFGKKEELAEEIFISKEPPFKEAIDHLKELRERVVTNKEQAKQLHAELTNIFKRYLLRANSINTLKSTSDEILIRLKDDVINQSQLSVLAEALRLNDAVKFAGYFPAKTETDTAIEQTETIIKRLNQNKQV
ncbi:MAG: hypothetical protein HYX40_08360 [Sphingobacteriales bacterium]|nr:hypothetical protein [Sphingobacteriales bacterium]